MGWILSRLDGLKFHPAKPGSCNHYLEKPFYQSYWKYCKRSLCKKQLYKDLSKNSRSVSDIKNTILKHLQICSKTPTKSVLQVLSPELISPVVIYFLGLFYTLGTATFKNNWECLLFFIFSLLQCVKQEFTFFVSSNQMPCTCFLQTGYFSTCFSKILHILKWKYGDIIYLTIYYSLYCKNIT